MVQSLLVRRAIVVSVFVGGGELLTAAKRSLRHDDSIKFETPAAAAQAAQHSSSDAHGCENRKGKKGSIRRFFVHFLFVEQSVGRFLAVGTFKHINRNQTEYFSVGFSVGFSAKSAKW